MTVTEPTIDTVLTPNLIALEEPPADKEASIEFLLDRAVEAGRVTDRQAALEALLAREEETTTGVGKGIGIPHAKTDAVSEPTIVFARSSAGVDFDAMDGEPATLLFMLLVPADGGEDHLELLSSLSRALMHDDVRERLHEAESKDAIRETITEAID
ncbi:PTS sugar transporter subunit IIA [Natrinema salifodinae]|uniref:PTS system D-fructose-specific IIA component (F1P-forming), Frc family n=1 Tax=Natrinema salifodinae TaxID=1202768 RepID=A0A1I0PB28_9EURY|nr:fructose PTS transporter subunit IIA [Natrinema salifodinae]SEW10768.1 PTS system D-fructose-specific IIA component (F1P-forming), Frc family [Natrinema salifodinae]